MRSQKSLFLCLLLAGFYAGASMAQYRPDLALSGSRNQTSAISAQAASTVTLRWTIDNPSLVPAPSANIAVFLTQNDASAVIAPPDGEQSIQPGKIWRGRGSISSSLPGQPHVGGILVYQDSTGDMPGKSSKAFEANIPLPRSIQPGDWNLLVVVDSPDNLLESDETNNIKVFPVTIALNSADTFTLGFEGLSEGLVPSDYYANYGVTIQNITALLAYDYGGTGYFCSIHNGSPTAAYMPRLTNTGGLRTIVDVADGFSDVSLIYAQAEVTQGGFHIWSGANGTGSILYTYFFFSHPNNGLGDPCGYDVWYDTGVIQVSGRSIEFFENDSEPAGSYMLTDNFSFTPSRNEIVVHGDPIVPYEGESDGHTFGITLAEAVPSGKTVTIKLQRLSPSSSGESMAVLGTSSVTFNSSNWNVQKPLTIWAPENDQDTNNQVKEFRLYRSGGTSPQTIPDRIVSATEIDDDFRLTVDVSSAANHGTVDPVINDDFFDYNDDDWPSLILNATPDTGYLFAEWTVTFSGVNDDLSIQLFGPAQSPTQIAQLVLDSGGGSSFGVFANFEEIGPVTVSMHHNGSGTTRVRGQVVGNNQSIQIDPVQNVSLSATPASGYAFSHWTSVPSGVILDPNSANTFINTSTNTSVTANFVLAPVTVTVFHAGDGSTTVNGQTVEANQSIQIAAGQNIAIEATPDTEWEFTGWTSSPNGIIANPNNNVTTVNTTVDASLTANFNFVGTAFTVQSSGHGTTNPSGMQFVNSGDSVVVEVFPESGYKFKDWTMDTGTPEIIPISNMTDQFLVTVTEPTVIIANFEELAPASLLIRATNLQDTGQVVLLREPDQVVQELFFIKQQGGSANTFKLAFFNEGDIPLTIETVTLDDRLAPLPTLSDSGFCLMTTPDFDPIDCVIEQPLSPDPLPPVGTQDPPTLYLDFGREPGFPDIPNPTYDYYVGSFAYFVQNNQTALVFDFQGIVQGGADVSNITLKKILPEPVDLIPNGGHTTLDPVSSGSTVPITFELINGDNLNPFFADKHVSNSNDGTGVDPNQYGFFFQNSNSITVTEGESQQFGMLLKTMTIGDDEPPVTYSAMVELGTGNNIYSFEISAVADGTGVTVVAKINFGDGNFGLEEVLEGKIYDLEPDAPESGSIYEFLVLNPSTQQDLEISNLRLEPYPGNHGVYSIEQDQSTLPGTIGPSMQKSFSIRLEGPEEILDYYTEVFFDYRSPSGAYKTFTFTVKGTIGDAFLDLIDDIELPLPNFDHIPLPPSNTGQNVSKTLEIRHQGQAGDPVLSGSIQIGSGSGFGITNPNFSIQPGASHAFAVNFNSPTAGDFAGIVAIASNDPVVDTFVLNFTGTVFEPGAPPTQVPDFVGTINGLNIDGLEVYDTSPAIDFTWGDAQSPVGIQLYHIVVQPTGGPWQYSPTFPTPANSATIQTEDLVVGTSYSIHIRAKDTNGVWGPFKNGGSFTVTEPQPPSTVPNFAGRIDGQDIDGLEVEDTSPAIDFTWSHAQSPVGIKTYQIVVQPIGGPFLYSQTVPYPSQAHTIQTSGLVPGTSYSTHIRAKDNLDVWGPFIHGQTFTIAEISPPGQVPSFVGKINGQNVAGLDVYSTEPLIEFTWAPPASTHGIERYNIVVQPTDGSGWLYNQAILYPATSHSIQTSNLEIGQSYSVHIRAKNDLGVWGPFANGGAFNVVQPGPPTAVPNFIGKIDGQNVNGLTVYTTSPEVDFTWNHASAALGIDQYQLVIQPIGGPFLYSQTVPYPQTSHTIATVGLQYGTSYSVHIRARDTGGTWGTYVNGGSFTVEEPEAPGQVPNFVGKIDGVNATGLTVETNHPDIDFTWSHPTSGLPIDHYQIIVQPTDGSGWLYTPLVAYPATSHTVQTSDLAYGQSYSMHIRARDTAGVFGPFVNIGAFTVVAPVPKSVTNFIGKINGQNINGLTINITNPAIDFTWSAGSDPSGIESYQIVVQPTDGSGWLYSPHVLAPATTHTIQTSGLVPGQSYSIHIRAKNNLGTWGPFTNGGSFTVQ